MKKIFTLLVFVFSGSLAMAQVGNCNSYFSYQTDTNNVAYFLDHSTAYDSLQGTDSIVSWNWSFGDGTTSADADPDHQFTSTSGYACLTITTQSGCSSTHCDSIIFNTNPNPCQGLQISFTSVNESAPGAHDGAIDISVYGGIAPFVYNWNNGAASEDLGNLSAGFYTVSVTDANGCSGYQYISILGDSVNTGSGCQAYFYFQADSTGFVHFQNNSSSDSSGVTYLWDFYDGSTSTDQNPTHAFTNGNGYVCLTITTGNGCTNTYCDTIVISMVNPCPTLQFGFATVNESAPGAHNGAIDISVNGGTAPYVYSWSNNSTTEDLGNLSAGVYTVSVTDFNGCVGYQSIYVHSDSTTTSNGCQAYFYAQADSSGLVHFQNYSSTDSSGVTYSWDFHDGTTSSDQNPTHTFANGIGYVCLNITTGNGCSNTYCDTIVISTVTPCTLSMTYTSKNESFMNSHDGSIDITVSGGTAPYSYAWNTGETTEDIDNLSGGVYYVQVMDANNCYTYEHIYIFGTPDSSSTLNLCNMYVSYQSSDVTQIGANDGQVDLQVYGGTSPYTYYWSNGETTEDLSNLSGGAYSVSVIDANNCYSTASVFIFEPMDSTGVIYVQDSLYTTPVDTCFEFILNDVFVYNINFIDTTQMLVTWAFAGQDSLGVDSIGYIYVTYTFNGYDGIYDLYLTYNCDGKRGQSTYTDKVIIDRGIESPTGISNAAVENINEVKIYPNPASNNVNINFSSTEAQVINTRIINELGQVVYATSSQSVVGNNLVRLDVSSLKQGIYFVQLRSNKGDVNSKLLIK